jgi:hypothetical protein
MRENAPTACPGRYSRALRVNIGSYLQALQPRGGRVGRAAVLGAGPPILRRHGNNP